MKSKNPAVFLTLTPHFPNPGRGWPIHSVVVMGCSFSLRNKLHPAREMKKEIARMKSMNCAVFLMRTPPG